MQLRRLTAVLLVMVTGAGIALFLFSRLAVAELLALAMLGVFWVLLPVLFLSAITWTYVRDRLIQRESCERNSQSGFHRSHPVRVGDHLPEQPMP